MFVWWATVSITTYCSDDYYYNAYLLMMHYAIYRSYYIEVRQPVESCPLDPKGKKLGLLMLEVVHNGRGVESEDRGATVH